MRFRIATICIALATVPAASAAQTLQQPAATTPAKSSKASGNPDKIVCREFETTGSRLNRKRDCRTAQQWVEQNATDRQALDLRQANRYKDNN